MSPTKKTGKPPRGEVREPLTVISFRADEETLQALAELEAQAGGKDTGCRSAVIRDAIIEAVRTKREDRIEAAEMQAALQGKPIRAAGKRAGRPALSPDAHQDGKRKL